MTLKIIEEKGFWWKIIGKSQGSNGMGSRSSRPIIVQCFLYELFADLIELAV
jgi:hypothetical protein